MNFFENRLKQIFIGFSFVASILFFNAAALGQEQSKKEQSTEAKADQEIVSVNWMTFEEAVEKSKTEKKKIFVDVYATWCGWCKAMDTRTFKNPEVAKLINEKFYPVKFDAEQLGDVVFKDRTYHFVPRGRSGYHQLTALLLNNKLSYPAVVFLDEDLAEIHPIAGYKKANDLYPLLVFFADDHYKESTNAWEKFQKNYKSPF